MGPSGPHQRSEFVVQVSSRQGICGQRLQGHNWFRNKMYFYNIILYKWEHYLAPAAPAAVTRIPQNTIQAPSAPVEDLRTVARDCLAAPGAVYPVTFNDKWCLVAVTGKNLWNDTVDAIVSRNYTLGAGVCAFMR